MYIYILTLLPLISYFIYTHIYTFVKSYRSKLPKKYTTKNKLKNYIPNYDKITRNGYSKKKIPK